MLQKNISIGADLQLTPLEVSSTAQDKFRHLPIHEASASWVLIEAISVQTDAAEGITKHQQASSVR